ncbi:MAG TPA: DUF2852 domain-containing protein [Xanthobacteraceae bacterium]|jgi:hypothetical protein|nr:DUF2852 domain-containing protein [Xanthobacteraceae bacterium]
MPVALIALITLGFVWWWPLGLVVLLFFLGSKRMGCWNRYAMSGYGPASGEWSGHPHWQAKMDRLQSKMDRMRSGFGGCDWWGGGSSRSSGNHAFDDYRKQTLSRLEDEQREFREFLERLRFAKDRQEFDQFMAERRNQPNDPPAQPQASS